MRPPILTGDQWMRDVNRRLVSLEMRSSSSGSAGTPGPPGTPGSKWYSGDGAPSGSLGVVGDWYMDDVDGSVYEKTASTTWTLRDNLTGPQGEPGVSVGNVSYRYRDASTASDPGHGNIKANTTDPALATEWYASVYDTEGAIVRFDWVEIGGTFAIYVSGDVDTWDRYEVTGPVINHGNEWFTIPAVWNSSGPLPFNPANGTRVQVQTPVRGEPGPQGPPGEQGEPGVKGDPGAAGPPNTLTIGTVTTGPSAATITGTSPNQVLNLTLAQGVKGDKGDQGTPGIPGIQGIQGEQGEQGIQGVKGDQGDQGSPGIPGIQGIQGEPGVKGDPGTPGEKWFSGAGAPAGATGIVGDWYLDTSTGDVYEKTGASAWTSRGNIRGPQGIQGEPGPPGSAAGLPPATPEGALFTAVGGAWVADTTPVVTSLTTPSINPGAGALTITGQVTMNMDLAVPTGTIAGAVLRATNSAATTLAGTAHAIQAGPTATANLALDSTSIQARNNGAPAPLSLNALGGDVSISPSGSTSMLWATAERFTGDLVRATSPTTVTLGTSTHALVIGNTASTNLVFDSTTFQARSNGAASTMKLNPLGGQVTVGAAGGTYIPGSPESVATKKYVDDRPPNAHTHDAGDVISGIFAIGRLPVAASGQATQAAVVSATDVRLSDARTPTSHTHAAADVISGTFDIGRIPVAASGVSNTTSVVRADDSRLSDARAPLAHVHAAADTTSGTFDIARLPVAASGTSSSTSVVRADDSRLSNARTPTAHTHDASAIVTGRFTNATATQVEAIVTGDSLDQYTVPGVFYQPTNGNATLALHYPLEGVSGGLEVLAAYGGGVVWQRYTTRAASTGVVRIFTRCLTTWEAPWGPWFEYSTAPATGGSVSMTVATVGTAVSASISFPANKFGTTNNIGIASSADSSNPASKQTSQNAVTTNGFTLWLNSSAGTGAVRVRWVAVEG